ncbi:hypothetical protein T492DRAFT_447191 [Pavlovales sp. CCMP2436]|nr:hypothetical protein T492DRAFT_447191 [Pavlovales sp. CCMP2436]
MGDSGRRTVSVECAACPWPVRSVECLRGCCYEAVLVAAPLLGVTAGLLKSMRTQRVVVVGEVGGVNCRGYDWPAAEGALLASLAPKGQLLLLTPNLSREVSLPAAALPSLPHLVHQCVWATVCRFMVERPEVCVCVCLCVRLCVCVCVVCVCFFSFFLFLFLFLLSSLFSLFSSSSLRSHFYLLSSLFLFSNLSLLSSLFLFSPLTSLFSLLSSSSLLSLLSSLTSLLSHFSLLSSLFSLLSSLFSLLSSLFSLLSSLFSLLSSLFSLLSSLFSVCHIIAERQVLNALPKIIIICDVIHSYHRSRYYAVYLTNWTLL